ncbi:hypothetical protein [Streptomyces sp. Ag109_G2-15]|uniref:hypothetical protein n=1 Tax=Streptomyces sp. Ag109_G2-15 TaxID=1938850 RepID=UPI000BC696C0|nr:hypothetical protein [Streptomyces sp. Ag109_G2-15]SOD89828.1 hypothetical protein SAMN06272765_6267 [Streptomyces sp. Ag109_G2-15]
MRITADHLLSALEPLPFPARLSLTARTAHGLAGSEQLAPLLADLDARGPYERRLAALAAFAAQDAGFLAARLADPDPVVAGYALRAARVLPVPDEAVEAAYDDAPAALRHRLARLLASGGRTALAERLVVRRRAEWGDAEAARLLPACSTPFVAEHLPALAHAVGGWTKLARRHPGPVLDHAEASLAERTRGKQREEWWRLHAATVAVLAPLRPERVLTLLERYGPHSLPPVLNGGLGPLATTDAERVVRWITSPDRREQRYEPMPRPGVLRRLVRAEPASLPALGRHWLHRDDHFAALLKAMAPGRRPAFLDAVTADGVRREPALAVLDLLPRERRWAEVRRAAAEATGENWWADDLDTLGHGPFEEARSVLAAIRRPDAADRAVAWPLLVAAAARDGGRDTVTEVLTEAGRLRNDHDPVRAAALRALAAVHPRLFGSDDAALLDRIAVDALEARDCSIDTRTAVRTLAARVLAEYATDGASALRPWALRTLERITARAGAPDFGPLHRILRRGQEHQVFAALRPWLEAAAGRADFRLLLGLADALGPRARLIPELQDMLATALERGDDDTFEAAAAQWLAAPATRDERVAEIVAREASAVVLPSVRRVLARRRTDLLDVLLADAPPYGRFLVPGAGRPLPNLGDSDRWLPRQQQAAARLAGQAAADASLPLDDRAAAIRAAAPVPELGRALAMRFKDDGETVVAEAALAALPWTDRPHQALPVLLEQAGGDRARVAVYAAERAARFTAPSELALQLGPLLTGERSAKVTSRKEAVRLAARFLPPEQAVTLLARAFHAPDRHPDVRSAVVRALPPLLGMPEAWDLLRDAAHDDAPAVLEALLHVTPWELGEAHRAPYAALVDAAYDACLASADGFAGYGALQAVGVWTRFAPRLADRLSRTVCDLGSRTHWQYAAWVLCGLAVSDLPHPVGGAAPGSMFHGAVAGLMAALHEPEGGCDALEHRDLPALQRLRTLVSLGSHESVPPELLAALVGQLAPEPLLTAERAELLGRMVDRASEPAALLGRLQDLADALEGAGVTVAAQTAVRLRASWIRPAPSQDTGAVLAAADRLARDRGAATGLLALALVTATGGSLGWPEEWRSLLRLLRRHAQPDVRHEAYRTVTESE